MGIADKDRSFIECPRCASKELRRSRGRGIFERILLRAIGKFPYRCDECDLRFYAKGRMPKLRF
jgi:DNA-directed RNA polymerase subunit RPC12/RpoP